MLLVFFLSAVMHELAVAVPLRMLRGWAFWGMFLQVSLQPLEVCYNNVIDDDVTSKLL
jgi:diacylglycerol O-acyltransferase-1